MKNVVLEELLKTLSEITPITAQNMKTNFELTSEKIEKITLLISIGLFLILLAFAGLNKLIPLPDFWKNVALTISVITMIFPLIPMLMQIIKGVLFLFKLKSENLRMLLLEIEHDKENIGKLSKFNKNDLEEAREWLQIKTKRMNSRVALFFGNPERTAFFSLAGFAWSIGKDVSEKSVDISFFATDGNFFHNLLVWATAFLTGIAIGAVLINIQSRKYIYHLELIELTLKRIPEK